MSQPSQMPLQLRQLPIAAKLVLSVFLMAVGLGYFSAMVQLHMQHTLRNGEPMPGPDDLIAKFAGKMKAPEGAAVKPVSKIEYLIMGKTDGDLTKETMAPAFFHKSGSKYDREVKKRGKETIDAEREGERLAMREWVNAEPAARKKAYDADLFALSAEQAKKPLTEDYRDEATQGVKIKTLVADRCLKCHEGEKPPDLSVYATLEKLMEVPKVDTVEPGSWIRSPRQIGIESLTQSTHAHLLSFAVLFTLTGLVFAFSSYPSKLKCLLGPIVLIAQVADISCWWLARLDQMGPFFALCILGTGAVVGMGLSMQIVLSLFNMYGKQGKTVLVGVFAIGIVAFGLLFVNGIKPGLDAERAASQSAEKK